MLRNLNNTGCINWKLGSGYTRASHVMPTDLKIRGHNGPSAPYGLASRSEAHGLTTRAVHTENAREFFDRVFCID